LRQRNNIFWNYLSGMFKNDKKILEGEMSYRFQVKSLKFLSEETYNL
jgi:hypothetical protein